MKNIFLFLSIIILTLSSCTTTLQTNDVLDNSHIIDVPHGFDQAEYTPEESTINFYYKQSILFSEWGARFQKLGEYERAISFYEKAIKYNQYNNKAHFSLGVLYMDSNQIEMALKSFLEVRRQKKVFPYDIDYFTASQMVLSFFPLTGKVTSIAQDEVQKKTAGNMIVVNKGTNHGIMKNMAFTIYRLGNAIRDVETLEVIGMQRVKIADAVVVEVNADNSVCKIDKADPSLYVQIGDILETSYIKALSDE